MTYLQYYVYIYTPFSVYVHSYIYIINRREGKIVVMGSASALKGMKRSSSYSAARGAQLSYIQSVGVEVADYNIKCNLIAQNFVENDTYFPAVVRNNPKFVERLKRDVPLGR